MLYRRNLSNHKTNLEKKEGRAKQTVRLIYFFSLNLVTPKYTLLPPWGYYILTTQTDSYEVECSAFP